MKQTLTLAALMLAPMLLSPAAGADPRTQCEGIARFTPPPGWTRRVENGITSFTSPDATGAFTVNPSKICGSLDNTAEEMLAQVKALPDFRLEANRTGGKHIASGGQWVSFTYSFSDPSRPGQFNYAWNTLVAAGGRSVAITGAFKDSAAFNRHIPTLGRMVDSMQLTSAMVVEPGNPPLTRFVIDATDDFLEWLMQVQLTDGQKDTVESELRASWQKNDRAAIDGMTKLLAGREQLAALPADKREFVRQSVLDQSIVQWRNDPCRAARMLVEIYDCSHKPIANGATPLTRQSIDAFAEYLCFAAGQVAGVECPASAELKSKLADAVSQNYSTLPADQQQRIATMPLARAALRVAWPGYTNAEKQHYLDAWKRDDAILKLAEALKPTPAPASPTPTPSDPNSLAAGMQELQRKQFAYQVMSNCMMMQHQTTQAIIANMGGGYHYEYRWR